MPAGEPPCRWGPGDVRVHPLRRSVHERSRPDSVRRKLADNEIGVAPGDGALGPLHFPPVEEHAARPDLGGSDPLKVLGIELGALDDPEELGWGGCGGGGAEQPQRQRGENDCEAGHSSFWRKGVPECFPVLNGGRILSDRGHPVSIADLQYPAAVGMFAAAQEPQ